MRLPSFKTLLVLLGTGSALGAGCVGLLIWRFRRREAAGRIALPPSSRRRSRIEPLP